MSLLLLPEKLGFEKGCARRPRPPARSRRRAAGTQQPNLPPRAPPPPARPARLARRRHAGPRFGSGISQSLPARPCRGRRLTVGGAVPRPAVLGDLKEAIRQPAIRSWRGPSLHADPLGSVRRPG